MTRAEARTFLFEIVFQMELNDNFCKEDISSYVKTKKISGQEAYLNESIEYVCNNKEQIDSVIQSYSKNWTIARMPKVDLSILRLSITEFNISQDIPKSVTINEAVKLAKKYSTEKSYKFINGVLGRIANEQ